MLPVNQIKTVSDLGVNVAIHTPEKSYTINFLLKGRLVKYLLFGGIYNRIAYAKESPAAKDKATRLLSLIEQQGVKVNRTRIGKTILVGLLISAIMVAILIGVIALIIVL
jgi:hypothetical protein